MGQAELGKRIPVDGIFVADRARRLGGARVRADGVAPRDPLLVLVAGVAASVRRRLRRRSGSASSLGHRDVRPWSSRAALGARVRDTLSVITAGSWSAWPFGFLVAAARLLGSTCAGGRASSTSRTSCRLPASTRTAGGPPGAAGLSAAVRPRRRRRRVEQPRPGRR